MPPDRDLAGIFAAGLLDPACRTPGFVAGPRGKAAVKRYDVYRNNVTVSLIAALAAIYPVVQRITGVGFFRAMARFHLRASPPVSPLLFEYGRDFPDFIDGYEYAAGMPYLGDVARIERAWLDAYHAADASPLDAAAFAAVPAARIDTIVFVPHPATSVQRSDHAAGAIFVAHRADGPVGRIDAGRPDAVLVTRPQFDVMVRALPPAGDVFLSSLIGGETLGSAAARALGEVPDFDIAAAVAAMLEAGAFTTLTWRGNP